MIEQKSESSQIYARVQAIRAHLAEVQKRFSKIQDELTKLDNIALKIYVEERREK